MRQEAAGFHGENEILWNLDPPILERLFTRKPVEAVVDLDRVEVPGKVPEPIRRP